MTSTHALDLPALDGRLPLGFLAACGVLRLLGDSQARDNEAPLRLSWDPVRATARLHTALSLDEVVARLAGIAVGIGRESLFPHAPASFPGEPRPEWPSNDGLRVPRQQFRQQLSMWHAQSDPVVTDEWVPALVTDQTADIRKTKAHGDTPAQKIACVSITPFAAPSGQQTFRTMFTKTLEMMQHDQDLIRQALVAWRRVPGVTGEYLDHHVLGSATDRSDGQSVEIGVPGATWLALMALPLFPAWGDGASIFAGGWQRVGRRRILAWPAWRAPLDLAAAKALTTHPGLRLTAPDPAHVMCDMSTLVPLSVFRVLAAERRQIPGRTFAGVLTPVSVEREAP